MRKPASHYLIGFCVALLWMIPSSAALAQQATTLVIEGGTLIDGNGGAPIRDALIVIQGNRITNVSRKGQVSYPSTARVIRADGKFILPGYWENENVHQWYVGESLLNHGVTSVTDIGEGAEVVMLHREAVNRGKINGPRLLTGIARIGPLGYGYDSPDPALASPLASGQAPKSVEDARAIAKRFLAAGADLVNLQGGGFPVEYYRAAIEEAKAAGKPAFVRPGGPVFFLKDAALAGASILSQGTGIDVAIAKDPVKWTNLLDRYADMDEAKAAEVIKILVEHKMTVQANLIRKGKGFHKGGAERFLAQDRKWWVSNPNLRAYYPEEMFESELQENAPDVMDPAVRERRQKGYQNMLRFHNQLVQAGGRVTAGCNAPFIVPPGLCMHQELELFADAGFTPMQMIQAATKWPAEAYWVQDKLGTIEAGKLADVVIINADPLQDIRNLREVDSVIYDGKVQELGYHADYRPPFKGGTGLLFNPVVEGLGWALGLKQATFQAGAAEPIAPPGGPVRVWPPGIESISPYIVTQGSPATLTIKGFNFLDRSEVYMDNVLVPARRVSPTELQVTLDESLMQRAGRFAIIVKNPPPLVFHQWRGEDGTSNKANLLVNFKY